MFLSVFSDPDSSGSILPSNSYRQFHPHSIFPLQKVVDRVSWLMLDYLRTFNSISLLSTSRTNPQTLSSSYPTPPSSLSPQSSHLIPAWSEDPISKDIQQYTFTIWSVSQRYGSWRSQLSMLTPLSILFWALLRTLHIKISWGRRKCTLHTNIVLLAGGLVWLGSSRLSSRISRLFGSIRTG